MRNFKITGLVLALLCLFMPFCNLYAMEEEIPYQAEIIITKEDIEEAARNLEPIEVEFTPKIEKEIKIMEKRHFKNVAKGETDSFRIKRLEEELMGRAWEFTPLETRMRRLKLASSRTMLAGTSLPAGISRHFSPKRVHNDSIELREREQVGLIDGFMRLLAPDTYEKYKEMKDRQFEMYSE